MTRTDRCLRATFLATLPLLLLAASWAPLLQASRQFEPQQFRMNENRWRALPEASRAELRRDWQAFSALPEAERERYLQRMDKLRRMNSTLRRILGRDPRDAELDFQLGEARGALRAWLTGDLGLDDSVDDETLRSTAEAVLTDRIAGYLGRLVEDGRLADAERSRILAQPMSLVIRDALGLHAAERLRDGDEMPGLGSDPGAANYSESLRRSEREALEDSRSPPGRGALDGGSADPLRLRQRKLVYLVKQMEAAGMSQREIRAAIMLPESELEQVITDKLGSR